MNECSAELHAVMSAADANMPFPSFLPSEKML